jgi:hypothetical protein
MFIELVTGAVADKIWDERAIVASFMKDFYELVTQGKLKVFAFGCGGTGKSTFGEILEGRNDVNKISGEYSLSRTTESYGMKDKRFVRVSVPPGQAVYRPKHWGALLDSLKESQRSIVINVVAWGFHSVENEDLKRIPAFRSGITTVAKAKFLKSNREREIEALEYLVQPLSTYKHPLHMITLVTKQDLWWKHRDKVKDYYEKRSEYAKKIKGLENLKGATNFSHHYCSLSFGQINFKTADRHILFENSAGYDTALLFANFSNFLKLLRQISQNG